MRRGLRRSGDRLAADLAPGRLTVPVGRIYPLTEVRTAFDDFATGPLGKIVITDA